MTEQNISTIGVLGLFAVALVYCAYKAWRLYANARLATDTPTSNIRGLSDGFVELQGKIWPDSDEQIAPISGRPCVYFRIEIEQYRQGKNSGSWDTVLESAAPDWIVIEDHTGVARVNMSCAEVELKKDSHCKSSTFNRASPELKARLEARYNFSTKGLIFGKQLRYTEWRLAPNDPLYVLGTAKAGAPPTISKGEKPLIVSDRGESDLVNELQFRGALYGAGALACGLVLLLLWVFLARGA
jgi:hypothetical protein